MTQHTSCYSRIHSMTQHSTIHMQHYVYTAQYTTLHHPVQMHAYTSRSAPHNTAQYIHSIIYTQRNTYAALYIHGTRHMQYYKYTAQYTTLHHSVQMHDIPVTQRIAQYSTIHMPHYICTAQYGIIRIQHRTCPA